ncbi:SEC14P-LIKE PHOSPHATIDYLINOSITOL TRANSFER FAMILY PROTEIN [Salix koriyanagi]|uniref:SEC14P-LIKE PHOSPHATIDYLINOSITOL TRANSFER FAMILY PROTEIN n=1 Tax=Salix koriyanagi TaxID=2511006 RepID=A0A9Q0PHL3_9ROSI|nr:SEC14P-LIKE PHOSPHATIDYLINOSITOL TRANSFER FAMILY PROTEIN [Salix koriyanagi]
MSFIHRNEMFFQSCSLSSNQSHKQLVVEVKEKLGRDYHSLPEAVSKLNKAIKWREEFRVSELSEESVKSIVDTGKAYVHDSLDVYGKPVLIVVASKHFPSEHDPIENEKLCVFLIEKALGKLVAGKEQILGIFDLRGFSTKNADLTYLTFLFDVFYYYYPKRLGQVLFVEAPFIFKPIWQVAKPLLRSNASLVRFCSVETVRKEYFTEETLPASFREKTL